MAPARKGWVSISALAHRMRWVSSMSTMTKLRVDLYQKMAVEGVLEHEVEALRLHVDMLEAASDQIGRIENLLRLAQTDLRTAETKAMRALLMINQRLEATKVPVDGAGLPPEDHAAAIAQALNLDQRQVSLLVAEVRNALIPTSLSLDTETVSDASRARARGGLQRVHRLMDHLVRRAGGR